SSSSSSTFGVQSLEDALGAAFGHRSTSGGNTGAAQDHGGKKKRKKTVRGDAYPAAAANVSPPRHATSRPGSSSSDAAAAAAAAATTAPPPHSPSLLQMASEAYNTSPSRGDAGGGGHARRTSPAATISQPLTPMDVGTPLPDSALPSTPKSGSLRSLRLSDEEFGGDETGSQAVASSGEEDEDGDGLLDGEEEEVDDDDAARTEEEVDAKSGSAAPELVMPSITMPKRRPFTARGRGMGRLKVMVAGAEGAGKSTLVKSLVRECEDVVHVDPPTGSSVALLQVSEGDIAATRRKCSAPNDITEVHASTRAYPSWWSDLEESRVLRRRRKSMGDTVLERNLCFVDTPGYSVSDSKSKETDGVIRYIEALLHRNASVTGMSDGDLLNVLSGNGGVQVDV
ncbi:hypothetical protein LTS18_000607, partial [Coniosporium uncinatum]